MTLASVDFYGFGEEAFEFFEQVQAAGHSWPAVHQLSESWERHVHTPMEALLDQLGAEFGRDAYAYHLHGDPYLWSHQVGVIDVADTIGYRLVLSLEGLLVEGGWLRSSADQVHRYRDAIASEPGHRMKILLTQVQEHGFTIAGQRLESAPRGWPADHRRIDLLRYRTVSAARLVSPEILGSGSDCTQEVAVALRQLSPLTSWLAEHVGPRQRH